MHAPLELAEFILEGGPQGLSEVSHTTHTYMLRTTTLPAVWFYPGPHSSPRLELPPLLSVVV